MYTIKKPFILAALSPVHPGSGSDLGVIDLPIQRERHTNYPKIEASGIKGTFRETYREADSALFSTDDLQVIFGPEDGDAHQAAIGFMDARVLLFPVKSLKGTFAWITCLDALRKFEEIIRLCGSEISDDQGLIDVSGTQVNAVTTSSAIKLLRTGSEAVVLEEYLVNPVTVDNNLTRFASWLVSRGFYDPGLSYQSQKIQNSLIVLEEDVFKNFVSLSTEVIPRTRINPDTGTVDKAGGALWYEEYLPVETVMYSVLMASRPMMNPCPPALDTAEAVFEKVKNVWPLIIQIGGNQTIGKGFMKPIILREDEDA